MTNTAIKAHMHPLDTEISGFLERSLPDCERLRIEDHIASCDECLAKTVSAFEAVRGFRDKKGQKKKGMDMYLVLCIITFTLSFLVPRYFLQLLVATAILGIKWVTDSRSARLLVMIHEAWKSDGPGGASKILERLNHGSKERF